MENGLAIHMLTEKKYPLSQEMISKMLKKKLEVDHESSQAIELPNRFIKIHVQSYYCSIDNISRVSKHPTEGYEDAIVIPEINANFELKHGFDQSCSKQTVFFGKDKEESLAHILNSSKRNHVISSRFDESFYEAWDRFNDLLRACPHHGFSELHQLDTFYNALNANDQDSLNFAAGGNFLDKMPRECLRIIESKSKVRNSRNKAVVAKVSSNSSTLGISPDVAALTTEVSELKNMMKTMLIDKQKAQAPVPVKAVEQSCVTCGGAHSYRNCPTTDGNMYRDNIQEAYDPTFFSKSSRRENQVPKDTVSSDFVDSSFEPDPRVPLILGRCFLKTNRALIDVYEGELTLRVDNEAITYNLDQTSRYSVNYNDMTANRIDIVELACEEDSDFLLLEEADAFLASSLRSNFTKVDESYYDPRGDLLILEHSLNSILPTSGTKEIICEKSGKGT
ncbi:hypothetical protein Tco_0135036 [Tanacetum coccineum]